MANQQLLNYIKEELAKGVSKDDVKSALARVGWPIAEIEEAMLASAGIASASTPFTPSPESTIKETISRFEGRSAFSEINDPLSSRESGENWVKGVKPAAGREKIVIAIVALAFLLVAGGVFGYTYYSQIPGIVLKKMAAKMESAKTVEFSGEFVMDFENSSKEGVVRADMSGKMTMNFSGLVDATDKKAPNTEMKIGAVIGSQGIGVNFEMEMKMISQVMYLKINDFPMLDAIGAGELRNKWYKVDIEAIADKYGIPDEIKTQLQSQNILDKLTSEQIKQIDKLWNDEMISYAKKIVRHKDEKVNGADSYHYEIPLEKSKIIELTKKTLDIMGSEIFKNEEREAIDEAMKMMDFDKIDLWVGKKDNMLSKLALDLAINPPKGEGKAQIKYTFYFKDYNKAVKIEAPSDSTPIEDLLESLGMGPEAPEVKTDRKAISAMEQIALEAGLMYERDNSYVNLLCSSLTIKPYCDEIDETMGGYPLIRKPVGSRPNKYCAVIILKELSGSSKQYYCIDSSGNSVKTTTNPTSYYCTKTRFSCPPSFLN